jgi:methylglutaconyl-CoA hydratase
MSSVRVERTGAVGRIVLARPEKKNALDLIMARELAEAVEHLSADEGVAVLCLTAEGADFCAGADLEALEGMLDRGERAHREDAEALGKVFLLLRTIPKPVIAVVRGRALAGGAGLATACDIVIAAEGAQLGYPEVRVGFVPAMVMTMLRRSVGEKRAFELVATGRLIGALEALDLGLITRVVPDAELEAASSELAEQMARSPAMALRATKRLFYGLDARAFDEGIALGVSANVEARGTEDFRAGVRRFVRRER